MLKAIIFDFGGVLLRTHDHSYRTRWDDKVGLLHGEFENYIFNSDVGVQAQLGQVTWQVIWMEAQKRFHLSDEESHQAQRDFFRGDTLDTDLVDDIRHLKEHYLIGLLSNTHYPNGNTLLREHNLNILFDFSVTSAEVGIMKPDPQIYHIVLERGGISAHQALFIDDSLSNIQTAKKLGMKTIHFTNPKTVREALIS
ncbi:MAG: hypothetical protein B6242_13770 [Anaerolineaceae bacterium 4572_78]|nr:MAG: hypothetical protein B6242_13770 [Anaerolineaceae bacterium 4572_78]